MTRIEGRESVDISHQDINPVKDWIYASGPLVGRLRKRAVHDQTFLDDCAYGIAQLAAHRGPRKVHATDDLRVSFLTSKGEKSAARYPTVTDVVYYLYGAIFALMCGFFLGAVMIVPAISLGPPVVVPVDGKTLQISYTSSEVWSMSALLDIEIAFTSHALLPLQLLLGEHRSSLNVSKGRRMQQYDSVVLLKGHKGGVSGATRDEDGDSLSGDTKAGYEEVEGVGLEPQSPQTEDVKPDGDQRHREGGYTQSDRNSEILAVDSLAMLVKAKPLGESNGLTGRCIGKLVYTFDAQLPMIPAISHGTKTLTFRTLIDMSAGGDCRGESTEANLRTYKEESSTPHVSGKNTEAEDDVVVSIESLEESCREKSGLLLSVYFLGVQGYTTVTITSLSGRMTPYVCVPCKSI